MLKLFSPLLIFLIVLVGCSKEPKFIMPDALDFKSWLVYKDTNWNGRLFLENESVDVKSVSNFSVGLDTSIVVKFSFGKNKSGLEKVVFRFRKSLGGAGLYYSKFNIENIYLENGTEIYIGSEVKIDSMSFSLAENSSTKYELKNFFLTLQTLTNNKPKLNFRIKSSDLKVERTYFNIYKKGKLEGIDKESYNVDLKGGSDYSPRPLVDFKHDIFSPNDFVLVNFPTEALNVGRSYDVSKNIQLSRKGKFYAATNASVRVDDFFYKSSLRFKGYNWEFIDNSTGTVLLKLDSLDLQYFSMPF